MTSPFENHFAVVGLGGIFPGASNTEEFFRNIVEKRVAIESIPTDSLEYQVFYRPEVHDRADKGDKSYTALWATVKNVDFEPIQFRLPPAVANRMDGNQKLGLLAAREALATGCLDSVSKERVSVFMGNTLVGQLHHQYVARFNFDKFEHLARRQKEFRSRLGEAEQDDILRGIREAALAGSMGVTEDSAPGVLPNIIASRICAVFDLHGHAFTIDAACASGLAAIIAGIQQLRLGEADAVICGAADWNNEELGRIYFSGIGALSKEGSFPFDERASGFVVGDGAGVVVLKRLVDAIAAKDRIHAVVVGYGQCSDGRGKAIAAPNELWQARAIERAWQMARADVDTVELIEAHGTSTQVGDLSEVNALKRAFATLGAKRSGYCALGSVKSNIGHLKSAAGIAGFIKAVQAIDRKRLLPSAGFEKENPKLALASSPFFVNAVDREWVGQSHPRRAGVSAFGFGGADYHIALQEYREQDYEMRGRSLSVVPGSVESAPRGNTAAPPIPEIDTSPLAIDTPKELPRVVFFSGADVAEVIKSLDELLERAKATSNGAHGFLVALQNAKVDVSKSTRLALTFRNFAELQTKADFLRSNASDENAAATLLARGIVLRSGRPVRPDEVVVLFPGQGSQYPDMLSSLRRRYSSAEQTFARADVSWRDLTGRSVSELLDSAVLGYDATDRLLRSTENTHPALFVSSLASFRVLEEMGLRAGVMIGHSVGEFAALTAAGRLSFSEGLRLVHARAKSFAEVAPDGAGAMLAVPLAFDTAAQLLAETRSELVVANVNAEAQTILSGSVAEVERLSAEASKRGIKTVRLNVSHAFHSPLMVPAERAFRSAIDAARFRPSPIRVVANSSNEYYGESADSVRRELYGQITGRVAFANSISKLYSEGAKLFVEVGAGTVLSQLTRGILKGTDVTVLASDTKRGDASEAFARMLCGLFAAGIEIDPAATVERTEAVSVPVRAATTEPPKPQGVVSPEERLTLVPPIRASQPKLVYSGVAIGLPGSFKESFRDDNFEQLFEGRNLIERLNDDDRRRLVDLQITKVVKSEQGASFAVLSSLSEVIQLAGKIGRLDLVKDYAVEEKDVANMSTAVAHAVAAGYDALRDAQIPLVHEYARTAGGAVLPERWALPKDMQRHTGVIFANGFPLIDPVIREVSRALGHRFGHRLREDIFEFYDSLIAQVRDREARKLLGDWYTLNRGRLSSQLGEEEVYRFNHQLMTQISMQANNRLARLVNARGPNFLISAACSSTATAVTLAEELILGGRAKRMIVIGADDATSATTFPYLGAGFLSTGACTNESNLYEAALPFDRRRNGMIMGAGAVAIVVELESECERRGVTPVCELLGTHCFNTAGHASQLDVPRYAEELDVFMTRMERQHGLSRRELAAKLVYLSHETYTPPRGGCAESEAIALRHVFGEAFSSIEISNTKGMTGHTMGASLEDAVAGKALQYGKAPPVVNHREDDPALAGLCLSKGAPKDFEFALRMAAGFGSQGNYILLRRRARGDGRVERPDVYSQWLSEISGQRNAKVRREGRRLVLEEATPGSIIVDRPSVSVATSSSAPSPVIPRNPPPKLMVEAPSESSRVPASTAASPVGLPREDVKKAVLDVVAEVTGYGVAMLDLDMELEADLGIDTVKQATVLANLAERLKLERLGTLRLSEYPTLRRIVEFCAVTGNESAVGASPNGDRSTTSAAGPRPEITRAATSDTPQEAIDSTRRQVVRSAVLSTIASVTGYAESLLSEEMELEADLGIDTVKQATILATLGEHFAFEGAFAARLSNFSTIGQLIAHFTEMAPTSVPSEKESKRVEIAPEGQIAAHSQAVSPVGIEPAPTVRESASEAGPVERRSSSLEEIQARVFDVLCEVTAYPREILELDLELDADLGLSEEDRIRVGDGIAKAFGVARELGRPGQETVGSFARRLHGAMDAKEIVERSLQRIGCQRLELVAAELGSEPSITLAGKCVWVLGESETTVSLVAAHFRRLGATVMSPVLPEDGDPATIHLRLETMSGTLPDIVIDLTHTGESICLREDPPTVVLPAIARAADGRFVVFKWLVEQRAPIVRILAVTSLGGDFALSEGYSPSGSAIFGLYIGFYKALRKVPSVGRVSVLDLPSGLWEGNGGAALERVEVELTRGDGVEIGYVGGIRQRVVVTDGALEVESTTSLMGSEDVVVATGGGAGITARILGELLRGATAKVALVGRTALDPEARQIRCKDESDRAALRKQIQERLVSRGERVTPKVIEDEAGRLERCAEVHRTLERLEAMGCKASYYVADVCDRAALQRVVETVSRELGPITVLVHGAGLDVSRRIEQKTVEEFRRVHSVKSVGAYLLSWLCRDQPIRWVIGISSISGRFGNAAQLDYAAGNEFLNVMARCERRSGIRATSLLWSGWSDIGIAHRNSFIREHAEEMGLNLIEPDSGARAARAVLQQSDAPTEVLLHRGLGDIADSRQVRWPLGERPLIDWVDRRNGVITSAFRRFSPRRDAFLDQHRLAGVPLMPGVGFMEMMAETAALLGNGPATCFVFEDLKFLDAFKLHRELPRDVELEVVHGAVSGRYGMQIRSPFVGRGASAVETRDYASATVSVQANPTALEEAAFAELTFEHETDYKAVNEAGNSRQMNVIFGPLFNESRRPGSTQALPIRWGRRGIETTTVLPLAQLDHPKYPLAHFLVNPAFLDAVHQAGAVLGILLTNYVYLPVGAKRFVVHGTLSRQGSYRVTAKLRSIDEVEIHYDMIMRNPEGRVCVTLEDSVFRRISQ
ncbi:MAG: SDR family NAD(P)-dependent oxidoreductase [Polyangiaceae bacterium]